MRGRHPKPTALKLVTGNPGKRPLNHREPIPVGPIGDPPNWLQPAAKAVWREITGAYAGTAVLTALDRSCLTIFCEMFADWAKAQQANTPLNAAFISTMAKIGGSLGLNPSDRARLRVAVPPSARDPFDDLLGT